MPKRADAFVIWVDRGSPGEGAAESSTGGPTGPKLPALRGRVEHVLTSERAHFAGADELVRFLERQLAPRSEPDPG